VDKLPELKIANLPIDALIPYAKNARTHSKKQIKKIANSIINFGFNDPIAIDKGNGIIAGHGRLEAAKLLGLSEVPTIQLGHLTAKQQKAYILAHNRIALDAGWDKDILKIELKELEDSDLGLTGFEDSELKFFSDDDIKLDDTESESNPELEISMRECPSCGHQW
jgi:ParB-like chromosome segregation protein Spo0J